MVLAGHNHYYARAFVDGVHHVTAGGGGAPLHTPNPTFPFVVATAKAHHFCTIAIDGGTLVLTAYGKAGQVLDTFTVTHTGTPDAPDAPSQLGCRRPPAPNPSTGVVVLSFTLPRPSRARLSIYDVTGRLVRGVLDTNLPAGPHSVVWDGCGDAGEPVSSGVYVAKLESAGASASAKIVRMGR